MSAAITQFNELIEAKFINPNKKTDVTIESVISSFENEPLWLARALIVSFALAPIEGPKPEVEQKVLDIYRKLTETNANDHMLQIEAARAAAVFEDTDELLRYIDAAEKLLNFQPNLTGVQVTYSQHQQSPGTRMACLIPSSASAGTSSGNNWVDVELHVDNDRYTAPKYANAEESEKSTGLLSTESYLLLILLGNLTVQYNPAATTTVVNEQALPFVRRVTETTDFAKIDYLVSKHALYHRSLLEQKDINELERGTVELLKMSTAMHNNSDTHQTSDGVLDTFHYLLPISLFDFDSMTARRLVAMSDFANAVPIYDHLNQPIDQAICYVAMNQNDKAIEVLTRPELQNDPKALLLRGDICQDFAALERAWDEFKVPKAKVRLAQRALAEKDYSSALNHIETALSAIPTDHNALLLASAASLALENWEKSIVYLRRALAINDDDARSWSDLATSLLQNNQPALAHHALQQSIRVNQNSTPDFPTNTNFVALSAQLNKWDDVMVGLARLADAANTDSTGNGAAVASSYIARLSSLLPRLVETQLKQEYTGSGSQNQLKKLFGEQLPRAIPADDPMLCRLDGRIKLWAKEYQQGLQQLGNAFNGIIELGDLSDPRVKQRLLLYGSEYSKALEEYGDKEGRIEGSKAFPGWQAEQQQVQNKMKL